MFLSSIVLDVEDPAIVDMPTTITQNTDVNLPTAAVEWTPPTATDNSGSVALTTSHEPGSSFTIGTTTVIYRAEDPSGRFVESSFTVIVTGNF